MRMRLTPAEFQRATTLAATYTPEEAVAAGILDDVVPLDRLLDHANDIAAQFALLDPRAHQISKLRVRQDILKAIRRSLPLDLRDAVIKGVMSYVNKSAPA